MADKDVSTGGRARRTQRPSPRSASSARGRVVARAQEIFIERGYGGLTSDAVAFSLGLTRPAVRYHFPSKRHLFDAVLDASGTTVGIALQRASSRITYDTRVEALVDEDPATAVASRFLLVAGIECERRSDRRCCTASDALDRRCVVGATLADVRTVLQCGLRSTHPADDAEVAVTVEVGVVLLCAAAFMEGWPARDSDEQQRDTATLSLLSELLKALRPASP